VLLKESQDAEAAEAEAAAQIALELHRDEEQVCVTRRIRKCVT